MIIRGYEVKQQLICKNKNILDKIYLKKKNVDIKTVDISINDILNKMFDIEGNSKLSSDDNIMNEYYNKSKEMIMNEIINKYSNYNISPNFSIQSEIKNHIVECVIDLYIENDDEIIIFNILSSTYNSINKMFSKKEYSETKENNKSYIEIKEKNIAKFHDQIKKVDIYYYNYVYKNSHFYNEYKKVRYVLALINSNKSNNMLYEIDMTKAINAYEKDYESLLNNVIEDIENSNVLNLNNGDCVGSKCKYYNICNLTKNLIDEPEVETFDKEELIKEIKKITYPIYYLDFESFQCPYPRFENEKAYDQHVFQFSIIKQNNKESQLEYFDFIAKDNINDYRYLLFKKLVETIDIKNGGTVVVYNKTFEKNRILEASKIYNDLKNDLLNINNSLYDLLYLIKGNEKGKYNYYNTKFNNSFSIKKVLPALTNISYDNLDINNGIKASEEYANFHNMNEDERKNSINKLKEYCRLDTYGMYLILEEIKKKVNFDYQN